MVLRNYVTSEHQQAHQREITPVQLATAYVDKIKELQVMHIELVLDAELNRIKSAFQSFDSQSFDDFDDVLAQMYDWADHRRCWIKSR